MTATLPRWRQDRYRQKQQHRQPHRQESRSMWLVLAQVVCVAHVFTSTAVAVSSASITQSSPDGSHLIDLKYALAQSSTSASVLSSWDPDLDPCSGAWAGVKCGPDSTVVEMDLRGKELAGPVPGAEIAQFSSLRRLYLGFNSFSGAIPQELSVLTNLVHLSIRKNRLSGDLPDFLSALSKLTTLQLESNTLTGSLPASWAQLSNLKILGVNDNQVTGPIPDEYERLQDMEALYLSDNKLTGNIPDWLGAWDQLRALDLADNQLDGSIPAALSRARLLIELALDNNQLTGYLPPSLGLLKHLEAFYVPGNMLEGDIPLSYKGMTSLRFIDVSSNPRLQGRLPSFLSTLTNLESIHVEQCAFSGTLPDGYSTLLKLGEIYANGNRLNATIPDTWGSLPVLAALYLNDNGLNGSLPSSLCGLTGLTALDVARNDLIGNVPACLAQLPRLKMLSLATNRFTGKVPSAPADVQLLIDGNCLDNAAGQNDPTSSACTKPSPYDTPSPPSVPNDDDDAKVYNAPPRPSTSADSAEVVGEPDAVDSQWPKYDFQSRSNSNASPPAEGTGENAPGGEAPPTQQSGGDEGQGSGSGESPQEGGGNSGSTNTYTYSPTTMTTVPAMEQTSPPVQPVEETLYPPPQDQAYGTSYSSPSSNGSSSDSGSWFWWVRIVVVSVLTAVLLALLFAIFVLIVRSRKDAPEISTTRVDQLPVTEYGLSKIKKATKNFSTVFGKGSFGTVYLAEEFLRDHAESRAIVKRANDPDKIPESAFKAKLELLAKARHPCLVTLLGYCTGKAERILVYEYLPNGTLFDRLHRPELEPLPWETRVRIAVNVACALEFLHTSQPPLVHRAVTSSNILLAADMSAKLSDFGLARGGSSNAEEAPRRRRPARMARERGTSAGSASSLGEGGGGDSHGSSIGGDSDVHSSASASLQADLEKVDVYGFGVVLLELITGQKAMKDVHITSLAAPFLEDAQMMPLMVDAALGGYFNQSELIELGTIARDCVKEDPSARPTMRDVVAAMETRLNIDIQLYHSQGEATMGAGPTKGGYSALGETGSGSFGDVAVSVVSSAASSFRNLLGSPSQDASQKADSDSGLLYITPRSGRR